MVWVQIIPLVIIFLKMIYSFDVLIFWQRTLPTLLQHLNDNTPGCFTNRLTNFQGVLGMQRKLGITSECNVANVFFASYGWLKEAEENSNRKKQRKGSTLLWLKTIYLNVLLQKVFEITIRSSPASLIVASLGIPYAVENSCLVDPRRHLPSLSSLPDYFRS